MSIFEEIYISHLYLIYTQTDRYENYLIVKKRQ